MNTRERFVRVLTGQEVDRVPFMKVFGVGKGAQEWEKTEPGLTGRMDDLLSFEGTYRGWQITQVKVGLTGVGDALVLEEDADKLIKKTDDGKVVLQRKNGDFHSQVLEWAVKDRNDWDRIKTRYLQADDPTRFPSDWPAHVERFRARDYPLQLTHSGVYGFPRTLMGDVGLAYAFYDDPALVHDIMNTYTDMAIKIWERQVRDVDFDLIECWEDMASNHGSFISPDTFRTFLKPQYRKIAGFAEAHGIPIILVDSDGFIEDLAGLMLESGVNAMYPFEAQAGNDVARVRARYPTLGVIGGLDKNCMARDRAAIEGEMEKARAWIQLGRYIPGPDHGVLSDVTWENYRYFMQRLREVVLTTTPGREPRRGSAQAVPQS